MCLSCVFVVVVVGGGEQGSIRMAVPPPPPGPPPLDQSDPRGKKRNFQQATSGGALFGTQISGFPPSPLSNTSLGRAVARTDGCQAQGYPQGPTGSASCNPRPRNRRPPPQPPAGTAHAAPPAPAPPGSPPASRAPLRHIHIVPGRLCRTGSRGPPEPFETRKSAAERTGRGATGRRGRDGGSSPLGGRSAVVEGASAARCERRARSTGAAPGQGPTPRGGGAPPPLRTPKWLYRSMGFVGAGGAGDFVLGTWKGEFFWFDVSMCLYSKYSEFCGDVKNGRKTQKTFSPLTRPPGRTLADGSLS